MKDIRLLGGPSVNAYKMLVEGESIANVIRRIEDCQKHIAHQPSLTHVRLQGWGVTSSQIGVEYLIEKAKPKFYHFGKYRVRRQRRVIELIHVVSALINYKTAIDNYIFSKTGKTQ